MPRRSSTAAAEPDLGLLRGTLDLFILKTLSWGPMHGLADEASRMRSQRMTRSRHDEDLEVGKQLARTLIAIGWILLQQLSDDAGGIIAGSLARHS